MSTSVLFQVLQFGLEYAQGPHGLHVPANNEWCDERFCNELHDKEKKRDRCKDGVCHFNNPYGHFENIEGILVLGNATLCADTVPVEDHQRVLPMIYGYVLAPS